MEMLMAYHIRHVDSVDESSIPQSAPSGHRTWRTKTYCKNSWKTKPSDWYFMLWERNGNHQTSISGVKVVYVSNCSPFEIN